MEGTQRRDRFEGLEEEEKEEEEEEEEEEVEFNGDKEVIAIDEKIGNEAKTIDDKNLEMASLDQKNQSIKGKEEMSMDINLNLCPDQKDQEDQLIECAQANMGEVREENKRLRTLLARMMKDYQSLRAHFLDIVQQEQANKTAPSNTLGDLHLQEPELVSLGLGRSTTLRESKKEEIIVRSSNSIKLEEDKDLKECLALTLDCKSRVSKPAGTTEPLSSPASLHERILEDPKMEAEDQPLSAIDKSPSLNKTMRSEDDEVSQPTLAKKARVSVRARCDAPTMNDGCQWRKYGQKIAKGNPCPRAYYRCTIAPACPVRKQVQRCAADMSVLITTYEGKHNHPLPIAATAMASTTSAAARMLTSASSSSPPMLSFGPSTTTGLMNRSSYFYSPNNIPSSSSSPIISPSSSSHPTITLDLTSYSSSNNSSSNYYSSSSSTSLSFNNSAEPPVNSLPTIWGNDVINGYPSYQMGSSNNLGRQNHRYNMQISNPVLPPETISAATKAIASDPSFRSALVKAITSIVGVDHAGGKVCANSGLLSRSMSLSSTSKAGERSLMFLPSSSSSLSFPSRKNKSTTSTASPAENSDQVHR